MTDIKKEIYFYPAGCGDASRMRYLGNDGRYHNIFIDSGYRKTFKNIINHQIKEIQINNEPIDLWIVSHIHDDHIGGIEQFIIQIQTGESQDTIDSWFYNRPRRVNQSADNKKSVSSPKSIRQGDILAKYLEYIKKLPAEDIVYGAEQTDLFGLKIHILTPTSEKLNQLRAKYESNLKLPLEKLEGEQVSEAKSAIKSDYHIQLKDFDLSIWNEDVSIENGSSISVLTEYEGIKILWLADSHPSDIVLALNSMGYNHSNKIECDFVKVAHHGSKANNSNELYSLIKCVNYVFSADGTNKHKLPTKDSIARILRNEHRSMEQHYNLYFTHDNPVLRNIFTNESDTVYTELNFTPIFSKQSETLRFAYQKV